MAAADPGKPLLARVIDRLGKMGEGFVRRRGTGDPPSGAPATRVHLDLGDLPVVQLVHDLRNALTVMIACSDNIAGLVPEGQADQDLAELRRCASWALTLTRELLTAARTSGARGIVEPKWGRRGDGRDAGAHHGTHRPVPATVR